MLRVVRVTEQDARGEASERARGLEVEANGEARNQPLDPPLFAKTARTGALMAHRKWNRAEQRHERSTRIALDAQSAVAEAG